MVRNHKIESIINYSPSKLRVIVKQLKVVELTIKCTACKDIKCKCYMRCSCPNKTLVNHESQWKCLLYRDKHTEEPSILCLFPMQKLWPGPGDEQKEWQVSMCGSHHSTQGDLHQLSVMFVGIVMLLYFYPRILGSMLLATSKCWTQWSSPGWKRRVAKGMLYTFQQDFASLHMANVT